MLIFLIDLQCVMVILVDEDEFKVIVKSSSYGGLIVGLIIIVGGFFVGLFGFFVGGVVGGVLVYLSVGFFKFVLQIIKDMNVYERQLLYDSMKDIIDNLVVDDYLVLMVFLSGGFGLLI